MNWHLQFSGKFVLKITEMAAKTGDIQTPKLADFP